MSALVELVGVEPTSTMIVAYAISFRVLSVRLPLITDPVTMSIPNSPVLVAFVLNTGALTEILYVRVVDVD